MTSSMALMMLVILLVAGRVCYNDTTGSLAQPDCEIPKCLISYLQTQAASLQSLKRDLESTKKQLQQATSGQWPPGHYCILASGVCPAGFTRSQGHLRALSQFAASASYITPVKFGDSRIQCHGRCGQYGQWIGDLYMAACCK
ncbi:uncharacterized protein LOC110041952 [Orbicella faveolata]|uniref:uncharacterized protein LOC110041952 n=1 Tax=Orbicella faveolata TaxID=48498 RepID=UPI0009E46B2C|nr:uncharacterized protein LOC110041952 [Orbicella faveolata]